MFLFRVVINAEYQCKHKKKWKEYVLGGPKKQNAIKVEKNYRNACGNVRRGGGVVISFLGSLHHGNCDYGVYIKGRIACPPTMFRAEHIGVAFDFSFQRK